MAATFEFVEANGAGQGTSVVTAVNWKNIDDNTTTAYSAAPITAGNNSYEKWQYGHFTGSYNQISAGLFAHTANVAVLGAGLTLKCQPTMTSDTTDLAYATPNTTTNTNLTTDITGTTVIASGIAVWFGGVSQTAASKAASTTANPAYTNYLVTQLQTTTAAAAGDTSQATLTLEYAEN